MKFSIKYFFTKYDQTRQQSLYGQFLFKQLAIVLTVVFIISLTTVFWSI